CRQQVRHRGPEQGRRARIRRGRQPRQRRRHRQLHLPRLGGNPADRTADRSASQRRQPRGRRALAALGKTAQPAAVAARGHWRHGGMAVPARSPQRHRDRHAHRRRLDGTIAATAVATGAFDGRPAGFRPCPPFCHYAKDPDSTCPSHALQPAMPTLLIADDHPLFRAALRGAAADAAPDVDTCEAESLDGVLALLESRDEIDLVLLDLHMPGNHGLAGLAAIRAQHPAVAVVLVSANEDPAIIRRALDHGAAGYIPKSASLDELREAIRTVLACEHWLPPALRGAV